MKHEPIQSRTSLATFVLPCLLPLLLFAPVSGDAVWQVWIGRQLLDGAELYRDILEVNPPFWFWLAAPLAAVGEIFNLSARVLIAGFFIISMWVSLALSPRRFWPLLVIGFAVLPLADFGQREQFTLITTAPYAFLIAVRMRAEEPRYATLIGIWAALGFALKPYFIIVPLALEALVAGSHLRRETVTLGICAVLYALAVLVFAPAYLTETLPMLREYYAFFRSDEHPTLFYLAACLATIGLVLRRQCPQPEATVFLVATGGFLFALILQSRGFHYHSIPARGCLLIALGIELIHARKNPAMDAFLASAVVLCLIPLRPYANPFRAETEKHLASVSAGSSIALIGPNPNLAWPMTEERRLKWSMSVMSLWQIGAVKFNHASPEPIKARLAADLEHRPDVLLIDRNRYANAAGLLPKNYLDEYCLAMRTRSMESWKHCR